MRKTLLFSIGLIMAGMLQAHIQKGDIQLGGSVSFSSQEFSGQDRNFFSIAPRAGFFLSDLTALGFATSFTTTTNTFTDTQGNEVDLTNNLFQFGVFMRFHKTVIDNLYLYLEPGINIGTGKNDLPNGGESDISAFIVSVSPGMTYFLSDKFALEMRFGSLAYNRQKMEFTGGEITDNAFGLSMSLQNVGLGLNYFIRK